MPSPHIRPQRTMAVETFKILNNLSHLCLHVCDLLIMKSYKYTRYPTSQNQYSTCTCGKENFHFGAAPSSLATVFQTISGLNIFFSHFKHLLQSWNG